MDIHDIQLRPEAMELGMFQNVVMRHIEIAKEKLLKTYVILVTVHFVFSHHPQYFSYFCFFWAVVVSMK